MFSDVIASLRSQGFRLDRIMPADDPSSAELSGHGVTISVTRDPVAPADGPVVGRAGMVYRDLVPDRWGGAVIASHITIPDGGPVPDDVHHHDVGFQVICCRAGWVRVVYEDQGPPFVLEAGDVVLQPPGIRHRVLEASPGLEVVEVGSPAEHPTFFDHALDLPTSSIDRDRTFGAGQRFVRHSSSAAPWEPLADGWEQQVTGVAVASAGAGGVRLLRGSTPLTLTTAAAFTLLAGAAHRPGTTVELPPGEHLEVTVAHLL